MVVAKRILRAATGCSGDATATSTSRARSAPARSSTLARLAHYLPRARRAATGPRRGRAVPRRPLEPHLPASRRATASSCCAGRRSASKVKIGARHGARVPRALELAPVYPKAPRPLAYCDDRRVIGAPFYVMERVRGVILRATLPPGLAVDARRAARASASARRRAGRAARASTTRAAGLGDLGKPDGYVERQVTGWTERYRRLADRRHPGDRPRSPRGSPAHLPAPTARRALIHNDFKYDNLVLDPTLDARSSACSTGRWPRSAIR